MIFVQCTPLFAACKTGAWPAAKILVEEGAEVNARNSEMETPLIWAIRNQDISTVEMLIKHGADVQAMDTSVILRKNGTIKIFNFQSISSIFCSINLFVTCQ